MFFKFELAECVRDYHCYKKLKNAEYFFPENKYM